MAGGIKVRFAFGGPGLFLLESSSPFSTEERESVYYRCDTDALCRLLDPYLEKYPELLTLEEAEDCRLSTYLMKEAEYEYGSFGYRQ